MPIKTRCPPGQDSEDGSGGQGSLRTRDVRYSHPGSGSKAPIRRRSAPSRRVPTGAAEPSAGAPPQASAVTRKAVRTRPRDAPEKTRNRPRNTVLATRPKRHDNPPGMPIPRPGPLRLKNGAVFSNSAPECTLTGTSTGSYRFLTGSECSLRPQKCNFG